MPWPLPVSATSNKVRLPAWGFLLVSVIIPLKCTVFELEPWHRQIDRPQHKNQTHSLVMTLVAWLPYEYLTTQSTVLWTSFCLINPNVRYRKSWHQDAELTSLSPRLLLLKDVITGSHYAHVIVIYGASHVVAAGTVINPSIIIFVSSFCNFLMSPKGHRRRQWLYDLLFWCDVIKRWNVCGGVE